MTTRGRWIAQNPPEHRCILPSIGPLTPSGKVWECECGRQWVVYTESQYGEYWQAFREIPGGRHIE